MAAHKLRHTLITQPKLSEQANGKIIVREWAKR